MKRALWSAWAVLAGLAASAAGQPRAASRPSPRLAWTTAEPAWEREGVVVSPKFGAASAQERELTAANTPDLLRAPEIDARDAVASPAAPPPPEAQPALAGVVSFPTRAMPPRALPPAPDRLADLVDPDSPSQLLALGGWLAVAGSPAVVLLGLLWVRRRERRQARAAAVRAAAAESPAPARKPARRPSQTLVLAQRYELREELRQAGLCAVWEAFDRTLGEAVAVDRFTHAFASLDLKARETLLAGLRASAALRHPGVASVCDIVTGAGEAAVVSELLGGRCLAALLKERGRLSLEEALAVCRPLCDALAFAHARGLVHRDLNPANILLGERGRVALARFGLAKAFSDALSEQPARFGGGLSPACARIAGAAAYMSLETEAGVVRPECDLYSLGVCLYEMLTGSLPFPVEAPLADRIAGKFTAASALNAEVTSEVDALLERALSPAPGRRFTSASEMKAQLEKAWALR